MEKCAAGRVGGEVAEERKKRARAQENRVVRNGTVKKLMLREITPNGRLMLNTHRLDGRFKSFRPQFVLDPLEPSTVDVKLCFLKRRSKVVELVAAKDMVFGLTQSGVCTAFNRKVKKRVCFLNITPDEVIRSLFYNKSNESLITVSVYREDNYSSLKCRSTPLEYIRRGNPENGFSLFETESLRWPGFVEFDDVNGKVLTYSALDKVYKVWDLVNYTLLYSLDDKGIQEIKISPGIMLLIYDRSVPGNSVPLKILAIESGEELESFEHPLQCEKKIDFIEQFNEKLLVKQENGNLQIIDVRTSKWHEVPSTEFMTPTAFIFLYENQLFLTFRDHQVAVWNFRGELVTHFEDHILWHPDCNTNNIYITTRQDLIISYCRDEIGSNDRGSINVSDILSGKCLAKITGPPKNASEEEKRLFERSLADITALYYNEENGEILTGNKNGLIHVWSN